MLTVKSSNQNKIVFYSKRNRVYLGEAEIHRQIMDTVVKEYPNDAAAEDEFQILYMLSKLNVRVPIPYGIIHNTVYMQYLPGILLTEIIDNLSLYSRDWIADLAGWYYRLHRATLQENGLVMLKDDNNLRNFIYYQGSFYGLDFEKCVYGFPEEDIGQCCAFILTNYPDFTAEKLEVVGELVDHYCSCNSAVSESMIKAEIHHALEVLAERRKNK